MMMRTLCLVSSLLFGAYAMLGAAEKDRLVTTEGRVWEVIIYHEKPDRLHFKTNPAVPSMQEMRWSEVASIEYAGMDAGFYQAGMDAMASGDYPVAAAWFDKLVTNGSREWEQAYGLMKQGEAYELAENWAEAAAAYGEFAELLPEHRWYSDMLYRQGINLARAGEYDSALEIADVLEARYKDPEIRDRSSQQRAFAVRTAVAALQDDLAEAKAQSRRITLSERDGATYFHWTGFWAGLLMNREEYGEAAAVYRRVLEESDVDPARSASLSLGLGLALAQNGEPDEALAVLVRLDALPYGSPKQRLIARYWLGRLMWETASARLDSDRERVVAYAEQQRAEARRLLEVVVAATIEHPVKAKAEALVAEMPAPEGEEDAEGEAAEGEAAE